MPTGRAITFIITAMLFYVFANQTQIGWVYVLSALMGGLVVAAYMLSRRSLHGIQAERYFSIAPDDDLHEADDLRVTLHLKSRRRVPAVQVAAREQSPLAAPDAEARDIRMFVPVLPLTTGIQFEYALIVHRRGLMTYPDIKLRSRAPFGLFSRQKTLSLPTPRLVYPELRELERFSLLDRQPAAQETYPRTGLGTEVIGVRQYRTGDSPRHIHWRSVARKGVLISKEFAEETQPGLTLVLDRYCPLQPAPDSNYQPFEYAIKAAVSIADYARKRRYPLYLAADSTDMAVPSGAVTQDALLQYMARVTSQPHATLTDVLSNQPVQAFVAVVMAWPDTAVIEALIALKHRGVQLMVIVPDPQAFDATATAQVIGDSAADMQGALQAADIDYRILRQDEDWAYTLAQPLATPARSMA